MARSMAGPEGFNLHSMVSSKDPVCNGICWNIDYYWYPGVDSPVFCLTNLIIIRWQRY